MWLMIDLEFAPEEPPEPPEDKPDKPRRARLTWLTNLLTRRGTDDPTDLAHAFFRP